MGAQMGHLPLSFDKLCIAPNNPMAGFHFIAHRNRAIIYCASSSKIDSLCAMLSMMRSSISNIIFWVWRRLCIIFQLQFDWFSFLSFLSISFFQCFFSHYYRLSDRSTFRENFRPLRRWWTESELLERRNKRIKMVWNVYYEDILLCFSNIRRRLAADRQAPFDKDRVQSPFKVHKSFFSYVRCTTNSDDVNDNRKNMETKQNSQNTTSVKATAKIHMAKGHLCNILQIFQRSQTIWWLNTSMLHFPSHPFGCC